MDLPFTLETDLEKRIAANPVWQAGVAWGEPRTGHLEGPVMYHIADILTNIECQHATEEERHALRLIALLHDALKFRVDEQRPKVGTNHHAYLARRFAEQYLDDPVLLDIIEFHDEAYNSWRLGAYKGKWQHAQERLERLLQRIGQALGLYVRFFYADSMTESKNQAPVAWFTQYLGEHDYSFPQL